MAYVGFQQVAVSNVVKTVAALTVPAKATGVEIQADTAPIRYTMDGTDPTTTAGMIFLITTVEPKYFEIDTLKLIKFIRSGAVDGNLNFHYHAGRNV